ncbi:DMP19 family protein [Mesorhizobium sp. W067]
MQVLHADSYSSEVKNGGHSQFIHNAGHRRHDCQRTSWTHCLWRKGPACDFGKDVQLDCRPSQRSRPADGLRGRAG